MPCSLCMQVCLEYLERYYVLIAFTAYLFEPGFNPESRSQVSLAQWMKRRPELYRYQQDCKGVSFAKAR